MSVVVRAYGPGWGPRSEEEAVAAAKEVNDEGFLTGGPQTEAEWRAWREKYDRERAT